MTGLKSNPLRIQDMDVFKSRTFQASRDSWVNSDIQRNFDLLKASMREQARSNRFES